jgi:hypothetical protein
VCRCWGTHPQALGDELRSKFDQTKTEVLRVVRQGTLLQSALTATPQLDEKIKLRAPYVTPLNVLQVGGCGCVWGCPDRLTCLCAPKAAAAPTSSSM